MGLGRQKMLEYGYEEDFDQRYKGIISYKGISLQIIQISMLTYIIPYLKLNCKT